MRAPCKTKSSVFFCCREALVVCEAEVFDTFLAIAIDDDEKRALNREVWVATAAMNKELWAPHKNPDDREERLAKSIRVEDLGVAFVERYTAAVGGDVTVGRVSTARLLGMCGNHG
jgi:hypothetical protein